MNRLDVTMLSDNDLLGLSDELQVLMRDTTADQAEFDTWVALSALIIAEMQRRLDADKAEADPKPEVRTWN